MSSRKSQERRSTSNWQIKKPGSKIQTKLLKIFVGSWNVQFKELSKETLLPNSEEETCTNNLKSSYDYSQERLYENFSSQALTHADSSSSILQSFHIDCDDNFSRHPKMKVMESETTQEPLKDWIKPHDILVVVFQEIVFEDIIDAITVFLNKKIRYKYKRLESPDLKISGYGEGAFSNTKSTSMVIWILEDLIYPFGPIKFFRACKVSFGFLKGSKGAVSASLEFFGQKICFIGCHLPASSSEDRKLACEVIAKKLGENYIGKKNIALDQFFHHIIWAGDFNSRIDGIQLDKAMTLLKNLNIKELLKYDELSLENRKRIRGMNFEEQPINFIPSYKKIETRGPLNFNDEDWTLKHYTITPSDKWYKKKKFREQIPSWTDRIIFWSNTKYLKSLQPIQNSYRTIFEDYKDSPLMTSDHSPISSEFLFYG